MIWGGISIQYGKLPLYIKTKKKSVNSDLYIKNILKEIVLPILSVHDCMLI